MPVNLLDGLQIAYVLELKCLILQTIATHQEWSNLGSEAEVE